MLMCLDCETSGLPLWKEPSSDPRQPHIIQLAAARRSRFLEQPDVETINLIIKPDGYVIDPNSEASKLHGITQEKAMDEGVLLEHALEELQRMTANVDRLIGFNVKFDKRMIRIAEKRRWPDAANDDELPIGVIFSQVEEFELSPKMKPHCQLPPTEKMMASGRRDFKPPTLGEAFLHCYGKPMAGALHDALVDVKASMAVYWWLHEKGEAA